jgi:hypothetical protein
VTMSRTATPMAGVQAWDMPPVTLYQEPPAEVPARGPLPCVTLLPNAVPAPAASNVTATAAIQRRDLFISR